MIRTLRSLVIAATLLLLVRLALAGSVEVQVRITGPRNTDTLNADHSEVARTFVQRPSSAPLTFRLAER
jgi:hypothetical protein